MDNKLETYAPHDIPKEDIMLYPNNPIAAKGLVATIDAYAHVIKSVRVDDYAVFITLFSDLSALTALQVVDRFAALKPDELNIDGYTIRLFWD